MKDIHFPQLYLFLGLVALILSCNNDDSKHSKVVSFEYQGYSDTTLAILYGKILDENEQPLRNVSIHSTNNQFKTYTDSLGIFELGFEEGVFNIVVEKQGYQSVILNGFISDPDQVTRTNIQLIEQNKEKVLFDASKKGNH